jgi:hypothetical protein
MTVTAHWVNPAGLARQVSIGMQSLVDRAFPQAAEVPRPAVGRSAPGVQTQPSAIAFFHQRGDPCLAGGAARQREPRVGSQRESYR